MQNPIRWILKKIFHFQTYWTDGEDGIPEFYIILNLFSMNFDITDKILRILVSVCHDADNNEVVFESTEDHLEILKLVLLDKRDELK